jgi:hypothetical protein
MLPPMLKSAVDTLSVTNLGTPALRVKPQGARGNSVKKIAGSHTIIE